ncbi:hypothetical protein Acr_00g0000660 [Actinidia rufa]|uniref:Uncharacterized protein n=1 Tax=Actinidia rufa TaxID=165716 RepID=A0A7J0D6E9_9ERIC|nr:hypothetical protein Acr_00g0000660 [Actinidia rufa]
MTDQKEKIKPKTRFQARNPAHWAPRNHSTSPVESKPHLPLMLVQYILMHEDKNIVPVAQERILAMRNALANQHHPTFCFLFLFLLNAAPIAACFSAAGESGPERKENASIAAGIGYGLAFGLRSIPSFNPEVGRAVGLHLLVEGGFSKECKQESPGIRIRSQTARPSDRTKRRRELEQASAPLNYELVAIPPTGISTGKECGGKGGK